jgi:hypothetical protein
VPLVGAEATLQHYFRRDWLWGLDVAMGSAQARLSLPTLAGYEYRYSVLSLGTSLVTEWPLGKVAPFAGARLGYLLLSRDFVDGSLPDQRYAVLSPGLIAGVRYRVLERLDLGLRGRLHYLHYDVDAPRSLGYWESALLVTYAL